MISLNATFILPPPNPSQTQQQQPHSLQIKACVAWRRNSWCSTQTSHLFSSVEFDLSKIESFSSVLGLIYPNLSNPNHNPNLHRLHSIQFMPQALPTTMRYDDESMVPSSSFFFGFTS